MPKPITVRFYQVGKMSQHGPSLRTVLQQIFDLGEPGTRQRQLSGAFTCRLERLNIATPGYIAGEMIRVRSTDLPCEVHPDGTHALSVDGLRRGQHHDGHGSRAALRRVHQPRRPDRALQMQAPPPQRREAHRSAARIGNIILIDL